MLTLVLNVQLKMNEFVEKGQFEYKQWAKLLQVQLKICSRFLVLFTIGYCFTGTPQFSSSTEKHYETTQLQFTSFTFLREKLREKLCFVVFSR